MNYHDFDYVRSVGQGIRIHGNGFIQIDVEPGVRVHVFGHTAIPRQVTPTPIHDHRFGFVSTILSGCLVNVDWDVRGGSKQLPATHKVCTYQAPAAGSEDTKLEPSESEVRLLLVKAAVHVAGHEYTIHPGRFHETFANEATITVMRKTTTRADHQPRVLCRIGQDPDNSFNRYEAMDEHMLWTIVRDAYELGGLA